MTDLKLIVAKNIAELRKANNFTQSELAEQLNYSDKAVSKWERGESLPDIVVLKQMADLFGVTLDYLVQASHTEETRPGGLRRLRNHGFITGMSILLVWLLATVAFVTTDIVADGVQVHWLAFVMAVPVSMVVWLIFNSVWFNPRRNFLIVSLLLWTALAAVYVALVAFGTSLWQLFLIGVPVQILIAFASNLRYKHAAKEETPEQDEG